MASRSTLPRRLEKAVFQQFGSQCAFCDETAVSALEIHHIEPYAEVRAHEIENLILVCAKLLIPLSQVGTRCSGMVAHGKRECRASR